MLGRVIAAKKGKGLPPLVGRGFDKSVDGLTYTAAIDGKIERHKNRIIILPILEINGDVDVGTGNIDFVGDVVIHGSVNRSQNKGCKVHHDRWCLRGLCA